MATPGLRDLILLETAQEVRLSPDGARAAVRIEHPRWDDNRYCRDVVVVDVATGEQHRLTRFADCTQIRWLDDDTLAVLKSDGAPDDTHQVHVYEGLVGDGWQVTEAEHGVDAFEPYAEGIVFLSRKPDDPEVEAREEAFGTYLRVETDPGRAAIQYVDLVRLAVHERQLARATKDERDALVRPEVELSALLEEPLAVQGVVASPVGEAIYVNARPTDELTTSRDSSVHRIALEASAAVAEFVRRETTRKRTDHDVGIEQESDARREERDLSYLGSVQRLALPPRAAVEAVSPDGTGLLVRFPGRDARVSTNAELWAGDRDALLAAATVDEARQVLNDVTAGVDQACFSPVWHEQGIDVLHAEGPRWVIRRLDPAGAEPPQTIDTGDVWCHASTRGAFHTTPGGQVSFVGGSSTAYQEAWVTTEDGTRRLTDLGAQVADWDLGEVRTLRWTSRDGTEIEGALRLPPGFDPSRKHPLAFVVHGGPTWIDTEELLPMTARRYYPEVQLANFSSRGPRYGNSGIKPEITAPGVSIQAARAAGTSMGSPIDDYYTSTDGTSMAAPHVAGAAALLKQQHPDWDPETLKAALINSATPHGSLTVFQEGGGELDMVQAIQTSVVSLPGTVNLGLYEFPHDDAEPVTETVTYTNHGEEDVALDLQLDVTDGAGIPTPEGMLTVEPAALDLPVGASVEVEVTLDRSLGANTTYGGTIVALDGDGERVAGTPVGFTKEPELYDITVEGIQRNGEPAADDSSLEVLDVHDRTRVGRIGLPFVDGVATLRVPPGTYSVVATIAGLDQSGDIENLSMMGDPELEVTGDAHLVLDAGEAVEITVDTPYEDVTVEGSAFQYSRVDALGQGWTSAVVGRDWPYYVAPTDPISVGEFNFGSKFEMSAPGAWMDLAFPEFGALPGDPSYVVNEETTATVESAYHSDSPQAYTRSAPAKFPWEFAGFGEYRAIAAPLERVEHISANETLFYQAVVGPAPTRPILYEADTRYEPGAELEQSWFASPRTPALDEGNEHTAPDYPTTRLGDTIDLTIFEFGDANPGDAVHYGSMDSFGSEDSAAFRLYQDGELYAEGPRAIGTVPVDPESRLRFELDVARDADWWTTSTATHTAWEIDSATTETAEVLPLLQVDYDLGLNTSNELEDPYGERGRVAVSFDVRHPAGVDGPEIEGAELSLSYDDGETWSELPVVDAGDGTFTSHVDRYGDSSHASLRGEAWDADGNRVEQEVIRAYAMFLP